MQLNGVKPKPLFKVSLNFHVSGRIDPQRNEF